MARWQYGFQKIGSALLAASLLAACAAPAPSAGKTPPPVSSTPCDLPAMSAPPATSLYINGVVSAFKVAPGESRTVIAAELFKILSLPAPTDYDVLWADDHTLLFSALVPQPGGEARLSFLLDLRTGTALELQPHEGDRRPPIYDVRYTPEKVLQVTEWGGRAFWYDEDGKITKSFAVPAGRFPRWRDPADLSLYSYDDEAKAIMVAKKGAEDKPEKLFAMPKEYTGFVPARFSFSPDGKKVAVGYAYGEFGAGIVTIIDKANPAAATSTESLHLALPGLFWHEGGLSALSTPAKGDKTTLFYGDQFEKSYPIDFPPETGAIMSGGMRYNLSGMAGKLPLVKVVQQGDTPVNEVLLLSFQHGVPTTKKIFENKDQWLGRVSLSPDGKRVVFLRGPFPYESSKENLALEIRPVA